MEMAMVNLSRLGGALQEIHFGELNLDNNDHQMIEI
jgi:hypothetical protein